MLIRITLYLFWTVLIWNSIGSNSTRKWHSGWVASPMRICASYITFFPLLPLAASKVLAATRNNEQYRIVRIFIEALLLFNGWSAASNPTCPHALLAGDSIRCRQVSHDLGHMSVFQMRNKPIIPTTA